MVLTAWARGERAFSGVKFFTSRPVPAVGCTTNMKSSEQTAAIKLVKRKTPNMDQVILLTLVPLADAILDETAKKTKGTMSMKIKLRKRSPKGLTLMAVSGENCP